MSWSKWKLTHSLSSRLILGFVAAIIVTTIAAGVPAYWVISRELEQEAQARLNNGVLITEVLLEAEKTRLVNLASLTSQRPTLRKLLRERDTTALVEYIQDYQASVDLDLLILCDNQGSSILGDDHVCPWGEPPTSPRVAFHLLPSPTETPVFLAGLEIKDESTAEVLGYVTVATTMTIPLRPSSLLR